MANISMNNVGRGNVFRELKVLEEMLGLRKLGWSLTALARRYACDHTTIIYHCDRHNVVPEKGTKILSARALGLRPGVIMDGDKTWVNKDAEPPRSYREYINRKVRKAKEGGVALYKIGVYKGQRF